MVGRKSVRVKTLKEIAFEYYIVERRERQRERVYEEESVEKQKPVCFEPLQKGGHAHLVLSIRPSLT